MGVCRNYRFLNVSEVPVPDDHYFLSYVKPKRNHCIFIEVQGFNSSYEGVSYCKLLVLSTYHLLRISNIRTGDPDIV